MRSPRHAASGVVGPAGLPLPGPRGRRRGGFAILAGILVALMSFALAGLDRPSGTVALFVSRAKPQVNTIQGGIWAPDPPAACGDVSAYTAVVYGTEGDDVLRGGDHPQIIMGLGGDDTIYGGNGGDCLVGGAGNDRLIGGNAKDVLLGGPGADYLDGGNAKDYLDGEDDADLCDGGNGNNTLVNCEAPVASADASPPMATGTSDMPATPQSDPSESAPSPEATDTASPQPTASPVPDATGSASPTTQPSQTPEPGPTP